MKAKGLFFLLIIAISYSAVFSQASTLDINDSEVGTVNSREANYKNILIIPYDQRMYSSDIDPFFAAHGHNVPVARQQLRVGLGGELMATTQEKRIHGTSIFLSPENSEAAKDLSYIYASIAYKYKAVSQADKGEPEAKGLMKVMDKVKTTFDSNETHDASGARIQDGQIYSVSDNQERYMAASITNENLLTLITQKYEASYVVFVNKLDIKAVEGTDYRAYQAEDFRRLVKVHYTIFDRLGNEVSGGASKALLSSKVSDPEKVVKQVFPEISNQIAEKIPASVKTVNKSTTSSVVTETKKGGEHQDIFDDY